MLTRAGSLRCVRRNLIEADDNPHSGLRYAKTDDSATLSSSEADRCEACGGRVWFARRNDARFCSHTLPPKPPSANVSVLSCRHERRPRKVIARLRTATLPPPATPLTLSHPPQ